MTTFIMILHGVVCLALTAIILVQSGRGGGLTESFSSAESMFGAQTNEFMVKATTIGSVLFFVTCLGLAILSAKKDESLMSRRVAAPVVNDLAADLEEVAGEMEGAAGEAVEQAEQAAEQVKEAAVEVVEEVQGAAEQAEEDVPGAIPVIPKASPAQEIPLKGGQ